MSSSLHSMCLCVAHQLCVCGRARSRAPAVREAGRGMAASSSSSVVLTPATSHERQRPGPAWVQHIKKRMPRHQEEAEQNWFLAKEIPSGERWFQAEQTMIKQCDEGQMLKMSEAFDKIRRDLSTSRVAWYPQKWTTMVEGRPVQVQPCILPYNPLAEPDARRAKCHGHGGAGRPPSKTNVFSLKPACQKQSLFMSCRCHEK